MKRTAFKMCHQLPPKHSSTLAAAGQGFESALDPVNWSEKAESASLPRGVSSVPVPPILRYHSVFNVKLSILLPRHMATHLAGMLPFCRLFSLQIEVI